jgi:hypothetical protein
MKSIGSFYCILKWFIPLAVLASIFGCASQPTPPGKITTYSLQEKGEKGEALQAQIGYIKAIFGDLNAQVRPADYPNGVYVTAYKRYDECPITAKIFAENLRKLGFSVVDTIDKADVTIELLSSTMDFKDIENGSDSYDAGKAVGIAAEIGNAITTHGLSLFASDKSYMDSKRPMYETFTVLIINNKDKEQRKDTSFQATVSIDARAKQRSKAFFEVMSNKWLDMHIRGDEILGASDSNPSGVAAHN